MQLKRMTIFGILILPLLFAACSPTVGPTVIVDQKPLSPGDDIPAFSQGQKITAKQIREDLADGDIDIPINKAVKTATLPTYENENRLTFYWDSFYFEGFGITNASYYIVLMQQDPSGDGGFVPRKVAHYPVDISNEDTYFEMDSIGWYDHVCFGCISYLVILPEKYETVRDPITGVYSTKYTLLEYDLSNISSGNLDKYDYYVQYSQLFYLQDISGLGDGEGYDDWVDEP